MWSLVRRHDCGDGRAVGGVVPVVVARCAVVRRYRRQSDGARQRDGVGLSGKIENSMIANYKKKQDMYFFKERRILLKRKCTMLECRELSGRDGTAMLAAE